MRGRVDSEPENSTAILLIGMLLFLYFAFILNPNALFATQTRPVSGPVIDHSPFHQGVDVLSRPGESVRSFIEGRVIRVEKDNKVQWTGLVIEGSGKDAEYTVRILGIRPSVEVGAAVDLESSLGAAQDPSLDFKGLKPYLHVEVYLHGKRMDPTDLVQSRLKDRPIINPGDEMDENLDLDRLAEEAGRLDDEHKYLDAIRVYGKALECPCWEIANIYYMHRIADDYARLKRFSDAVKAQKEYLWRLKLELDYSLGSLPDKELGVIAAVGTEKSLRILIGNHSINLKAYENKQQTEIHY